MSIDQSAQSVFLNGKAQIIEMLQYMTPNEREKLLAGIRQRNAPLADELLEKSLTFSNLNDLDDDGLSYIFELVQAPILGVALKGTDRAFQRRVLSLAPREYAERAYQIMMTPLSNEKRDIKRAQNKVVTTLSGILRKRRSF